MFSMRVYEVTVHRLKPTELKFRIEADTPEGAVHSCLRHVVPEADFTQGRDLDATYESVGVKQVE